MGRIALSNALPGEKQEEAGKKAWAGSRAPGPSYGREGGAVCGRKLPTKPTT